MSDKRWTLYVCPECGQGRTYDFGCVCSPTSCVPVVVMPVAPVIPTRAEYDAALVRVRTYQHSGIFKCHHLCDCPNLTLAALGLDEPPTERVSACTCPPMRRGDCPACRRVMEVRNRPPTEPPKACPQWSMDHCSCPSLRECAREAGRR